jgi:hypothetical protein
MEDGSAELLGILLNEALTGPLTVERVGHQAGDFLVALANPVNLATLSAGEVLLPVGDVVDVPPRPGDIAVVVTSDDMGQDPPPASSPSLGRSRSRSSLAGAPCGTGASRL